MNDTIYLDQAFLLSPAVCRKEANRCDELAFEFELRSESRYCVDPVNCKAQAQMYRNRAERLRNQAAATAEAA